MKEFLAGKFDIAVIGAGHAGIEAALAAARMGLETIIFTINLDAVGNMPCNPAIGGTGKGHLVRELDALGGEMGRAADRACIQYRMLNRGKGPAVHSLRAQADRRKYQQVMKHTLERQENLWVKQAEVTKLLTENGHVTGVQTNTGAVYWADAVILCSGTYLGGKTIIGSVTKHSGPDGMFGADELTQSLLDAGLTLRRFKTGTPPRVNARLLPAGTAGGGRGRRPLLLCQPEAGGQPGVLLHHLHQRENPRDHPGQSGPLSSLLRHDRGNRAQILPFHRR